MKPQYESWKRSSHANVDCYLCHGADTVVSLVASKIDDIKIVFKHYTNQYEDPINLDSALSSEGKIPNDRCLRCHSVVNRYVSPKSGFSQKMWGEGEQKYHAKHLAKGVQCVACHNRVAHPNAQDYFTKQQQKDAGARVYKDFIQMEGCVRCHEINKVNATLAANFPGAPAACETCHDKEKSGGKPSDHLKAKERWLKPAVAPGFGKGLPEDRAVHTQLAKKNKNYCLTCHNEQKFCQKCHNQIEMPHPKTDWVGGINEHERLGRKNQGACQRCHKAKPTCEACHHKKWIDPTETTWRNVHYNYVKKEGALTCIKCHELKFCISCHSTRTKQDLGMP